MSWSNNRGDGDEIQDWSFATPDIWDTALLNTVFFPYGCRKQNIDPVIRSQSTSTIYVAYFYS